MAGRIAACLPRRATGEAKTAHFLMLLHPRHLVLPGLLLALAGLEAARSVGRLAELREGNRRERVALLDREQQQLAERLRGRLADGSEHAAYVARTASVRELLAGGSPGGPESELAGEVLPYLVSFGGIDGVRVFAKGGAELFRAERIGQGVGVLGAEQLGHLPEDLAIHAGGALGGSSPAVRLTGLAYDAARVEVPERDRQVLRYVAPVSPLSSAVARPAGLVVLTVYAAPLLDAVRGFAPLEGAGAWLLDGDRDVLAQPDAGVSGTPSGVGGYDVELRLAAPDQGALSPGAGGAEVVLRVHAPAATLDAESSALRAEVRRAALMAGLITLGLLGAALWLARTSQRELRLREERKHLLREREMEGRLQQAERLSALGLLTAGVAHEVNNPLEGVGNYLSLLERGGDEEQRARWLERVRHGFERIRDIVRQLSGFGLAEVPGGVADLARVADRALSLVALAPECKELGIDHSGLVRGLEVPGDAGRLEQVVLNLLLNAGRATGGRVWVWVRSERSTDGAWARLIVEDDGPGFAPDVLGRVFDPFFTSPPASSGGGPDPGSDPDSGPDSEHGQKPERGTGLGLSISYGIARAHGGELTAENRAGGGARLVMSLPRGGTHTDPSEELHT